MIEKVSYFQLECIFKRENHMKNYSLWWGCTIMKKNFEEDEISVVYRADGQIHWSHSFLNPIVDLHFLVSSVCASESCRKYKRYLHFFCLASREDRGEEWWLDWAPAHSQLRQSCQHQGPTTWDVVYQGKQFIPILYLGMCVKLQASPLSQSRAVS